MFKKLFILLFRDVLGHIILDLSESEADHSSKSGTEVKKQRSYTSIQYVFTVCTRKRLMLPPILLQRNMSH